MRAGNKLTLYMLVIVNPLTKDIQMSPRDSLRELRNAVQVFRRLRPASRVMGMRVLWDSEREGDKPCSQQ